jgi:queuine tRNA-ribosyltransferase
MVKIKKELMKDEKKRYMMGVGFEDEIVVCCDIGVDMFECVLNNRNERFGCDIVNGGKMKIKKKRYEKDFEKIEKECDC